MDKDRDNDAEVVENVKLSPDAVECNTDDIVTDSETKKALPDNILVGLQVGIVIEFKLKEAPCETNIKLTEELVEKMADIDEDDGVEVVALTRDAEMLPDISAVGSEAEADLEINREVLNEETIANDEDCA